MTPHYRLPALQKRVERLINQIYESFLLYLLPFGPPKLLILQLGTRHVPVVFLGSGVASSGVARTDVRSVRVRSAGGRREIILDYRRQGRVKASSIVRARLLQLDKVRVCRTVPEERGNKTKEKRTRDTGVLSV